MKILHNKHQIWKRNSVKKHAFSYNNSKSIHQNKNNYNCSCFNILDRECNLSSLDNLNKYFNIQSSYFSNLTEWSNLILSKIREKLDAKNDTIRFLKTKIKHKDDVIFLLKKELKHNK